MPGKKDIGKIYHGLTDDPDRRKAEHGNPADWEVLPMEFSDERSARAWEETNLLSPNAAGGGGGKGWRFGYRYTITEDTEED